MILERHGKNPVLTREDVPDVPPVLVDATSVFNPGACRLENGRILLLLRVQTRGRRSLLMYAVSSRGTKFTVAPHVLEVRGLERLGGPAHHVYDPRITRLEDRWLVTCALDLDGGCRTGIFATEDFTALDLIATTGDRDARNGVLFPEKVGGRYLLLERPNTVRPTDGAPTGDRIELLASEDLARWEVVGTVMEGRPRYWDERIGAGPPPVKTRDGWLLVYHGVATHLQAGIYQAGAALLDLEDPTRVEARGRDNVLEPREPWEMVGQVPNVVFPTGLVTIPPEPDGCVAPQSEVRLYYGAADTCVGLATAQLDELIAACRVGD